MPLRVEGDVDWTNVQVWFVGQSPVVQRMVIDWLNARLVANEAIEECWHKEMMIEKEVEEEMRK